MKRCIFALLLTMAASLQLSAQAVVTTKDGYQFPANEISLSYGRVSQPGFIYTVGGVFGSLFSLGYARVSTSVSTGAFGVEYMRYVHPHVAVGAGMTYENYFLGFDQRQGTDADGNAYYSKGPVQSHHVVTVMPAVKFPWFSKPHVSMYSKLAAGLAIYHSPTVSVEGVDSDGNTQTKTVDGSDALNVAFQVTPVGVDFGGDLVRGFAELGWGYQGMLSMGVRFRL